MTATKTAGAKAKPPPKRPRPDDLPAFDDDASRRRLFKAVHESMPASFVEALVKAGVDAHPAAVACELRRCWERAARAEAALGSLRAIALAEVRAQVLRIERALEATEAAISAREVAAIGQARIDGLVAEIDPAIPAMVGQGLGVAAAALKAELDRLRRAMKVLDGRSRKPSRLRLFANELATSILTTPAAGSISAGEFAQLLIEAAALVTGHLPSGQLPKSIAKKVIAEQSKLPFDPGLSPST